MLDLIEGIMRIRYRRCAFVSGTLVAAASRMYVALASGQPTTRLAEHKALRRQMYIRVQMPINNHLNLPREER
jgi:hypothetical protein